ncbi:hypothetical protein ABMA28_008104 [Loxostege sticticalis]|uniref:Regulatory protein zeste n=1 Tax=Loxostege sticticalis TaxID=481309 RepID=A0ABD0SGN7_LOXSC
MTAPPTAEQIEVLLNFLQEHQDLARGLLRDVSGRARTRDLWQDLANNLNACGGTVKTVKQWQRHWLNLKYITRKKLVEMGRHARGTGGGPPSKLRLTPVEEKVMRILGEVSVHGHPEVRIPFSKIIPK